MVAIGASHGHPPAFRIPLVGPEGATATGPELELGEDDDEQRARALIRRLWVLSGVLEVIYIGWILWEQTDEWKREALKSRARGLVARVLKPCHNCAERRREVNRGIYEAAEYLEAQEAQP